jgi:hypothetical protein
MQLIILSLILFFLSLSLFHLQALCEFLLARFSVQVSPKLHIGDTG